MPQWNTQRRWDTSGITNPRSTRSLRRCRPTRTWARASYPRSQQLLVNQEITCSRVSCSWWTKWYNRALTPTFTHSRMLSALRSLRGATRAKTRFRSLQMFNQANQNIRYNILLIWMIHWNRTPNHLKEITSWSRTNTSWTLVMITIALLRDRTPTRLRRKVHPKPKARWASRSMATITQASKSYKP